MQHSKTHLRSLTSSTLLSDFPVPDGAGRVGIPLWLPAAAERIHAHRGQTGNVYLAEPISFASHCNPVTETSSTSASYSCGT